ncbi:MAG: hypothetical protein JW783_01860, partial [Bacteroidales bacterium]|nr:hypothetical protein [Bacteroidales bacterium]MBN2750204.1 hypothetical protein [Bacteroidales bacterium]
MNVKCKFLTKNRKRRNGRKRRKEKKEEVGRERELVELIKKEVNGDEEDEEYIQSVLIRKTRVIRVP